MLESNLLPSICLLRTTLGRQHSLSDSPSQRDRPPTMTYRIHFVVAAAAGLIACATTAALAEEKAVIAELAVEPTTASLAHPDDTVQLLVTAKRSDGRIDDVTRIAQYAS